MPTEVAVKILGESRAGKVQVDIFDGTSTVVPLKKEGYVLQWTPEPAKDYPALYKDPEGYWVANNLFVNTPALQHRAGAEGYGAEDLSGPAQSEMARPYGLERLGLGFGRARASSAMCSTSMGEEKGMAYLRELSKQKIANVAGSAREVLDQAIAGEYQIALQIFNHHAVISAKKGAPVDWIKMEPATAHAIGALDPQERPSHPNAAKLLADFILSKEGQEVFRQADYITASPLVPAPDPALKPELRAFQGELLFAGAGRGRDAEVEGRVRRTVQVTCSPDGAQRNPGATPPRDRQPRISLRSIRLPTCDLQHQIGEPFGGVGRAL